MFPIRTKALLGFLAMIIYALITVAMIHHQRSRLLTAVQGLEEMYLIEEALTQVNASVSNAVLQIDQAYFELKEELPVGNLLLAAEEVQAGLRALAGEFPVLQKSMTAMQKRVDELRRSPERSVLVEVRSETYRLVSNLRSVSDAVRQRRLRLREDYRTADFGTTQIATWMGLGGIAIFGGLIFLAMTRLSRDLKRLGDRSIQIVNGDRDSSFVMRRSDEVGQLAQAISTMQQHLKQRELQLELNRQQHFHQDKMATIGVLSSGIAHEVNNPIAAIQAVAESLQHLHRTNHAVGSAVSDYAEMILEHTNRIASITRQLTEFSSNSIQEVQLVDLNELIRSTCRFISFDPRFRALRFQFELDSELPAIRAVSDHLTQVLLNLLINAADAIELAEHRIGRITVRTERRADRIAFEVIDTGVGMNAEQKSRAFDEYFTTKRAGKGTGIGLFLCRRIVNEHGGEITIESSPDQGTKVSVTLPVTAERAQDHATEGEPHVPA